MGRKASTQSEEVQIHRPEAVTENCECDCAATTQPKVVYRTARQLDDVESCLSLVHDAYTRNGIMDPHPARIRVIPHHTLPTTEVLLAMMDGEIACTSTMVLDGELGLPMDAIFHDELEIRRLAGRKMAEASCLAQRQNLRIPLSVVVRLMAMTIQCAKRRGADELLAVVHPHHADFYRGFLGFEAFGEIKLYPCVRDNPAVALSLDLHMPREVNPRAYKRLFGRPFPEEVLRYQPLPKDVLDFLGFLMEVA